ncbi:C40 family peptidase [Paenibacillus hexagrammi]|uniref:NlpC/P60 family protein n=1 Tax=Paenibacillus hexagrammi TaxID=2908839 RepID=A0ABY3SNJ9_9BACL|nr:NlpC/P60 family protein [Paenibacillus sp. YPD9-1]UJF34705.1 NlpC/P60 family protein [Paenibacillus sp. YPD9-1]
MIKRNWLLAAAAMLLTVSAGSVTYTSPAVAATSTTAASLAIGTSSSSVTLLQQNLKTLGYFTYPTATGYFGTITEASVKAYQTAYGLPITGIADSTTQTSIAHALTKKTMMEDAMNYLHVPYLWGGTTPQGFDCSGFVYYLFKTNGVSTTRTTSSALYGQGISISKTKLMPGDLVFFSIAQTGVVDHVGFYLGNNQFISATRSAGIYPQNMDSSYWGPRYVGAKRVY